MQGLQALGCLRETAYKYDGACFEMQGMLQEIPAVRLQEIDKAEEAMASVQGRLAEALEGLAALGKALEGLSLSLESVRRFAEAAETEQGRS